MEVWRNMPNLIKLLPLGSKVRFNCKEIFLELQFVGRELSQLPVSPVCQQPQQTVVAKTFPSTNQPDLHPKEKKKPIMLKVVQLDTKVQCICIGRWAYIATQMDLSCEYPACFETTPIIGQWKALQSKWDAITGGLPGRRCFDYTAERRPFLFFCNLFRMDGAMTLAKCPACTGCVPEDNGR